MGSAEGASVCVSDYQIHQDKLIDMDADEYGSPRMEIRYEVKMWFNDTEIPLDWWLDDLGNIWFEFESRGEAMLFVLECL